MHLKILIALALALMLSACAGLPKGIDPVQQFEVNRYLGTWYEIARLDHRFERGLSNVAAEYQLQDDGQIRVINRGFNEGAGEFSEAIGRAKFARDNDEGYLKVSFFGPFYGSYVVFELDEDYQHAYVAGNDRSYLWFLARSPSVSEERLNDFITRASELGFQTNELIMVDQSQNL